MGDTHLSNGTQEGLKEGCGQEPSKGWCCKEGRRSKEEEMVQGKGPRKLNNLVVFDQQTYDRMLAEVKNFKLVTPSAISERLKVNGPLARRAIQKLLEAGLIRPIEVHSRQAIYTRNTGDDDGEE